MREYEAGQGRITESRGEQTRIRENRENRGE